MKDFLKSVFSEADGTGSFGRIGSGLTLLIVLGCVVHITYVKKQIPDLAGPSLAVGTLYGINKAAGAVQKM